MIYFMFCLDRDSMRIKITKILQITLLLQLLLLPGQNRSGQLGFYRNDASHVLGYCIVQELRLEVDLNNMKQWL